MLMTYETQSWPGRPPWAFWWRDHMMIWRLWWPEWRIAEGRRIDGSGASIECCCRSDPTWRQAWRPVSCKKILSSLARPPVAESTKGEKVACSTSRIRCSYVCPLLYLFMLSVNWLQMGVPIWWGMGIETLLFLAYSLATHRIRFHPTQRSLPWCSGPTIWLNTR